MIDVKLRDVAETSWTPPQRDPGMTLPLTINGRFLTRAATGVDRFAFELLTAWWPQFRHDKSATVAIPSSEVDSRSNRDFGLQMPVRSEGRLQGHAWEQLTLPRLSKGSILVNLCNSAPMRHARQIVVLHDVGVVATPACYSLAYRTWHRWLIGGLLKGPSVIATVSKFSASEMQRYFGRRPRGFDVIYESGEHILREPADRRILRRLDLLDKRFVLAVGSRSPNKNLQGAIDAVGKLQDLKVTLVTAGGSNQRVFQAARSQDGSLVAADYVTNAELRALYEAAACFVFPSFYEGFGLPPLEAMHCGCPVAVSARASMPEVCGDAALYFDPTDVGDIAAQLRRILSSRELTLELREAGFAQARRFTWAAAAQQFDDLISTNFGAASRMGSGPA